MAFEGLCKPWMLSIFCLTIQTEERFPDSPILSMSWSKLMWMLCFVHYYVPGLALLTDLVFLSPSFLHPPPRSLGVAFAPGGTEWSNEERLRIQGTGLPCADLLSGKCRIFSPHLVLQTLLHYVWQHSLVIFRYDTFLRRAWVFFSHFFASSVLQRLLSGVPRPAHLQKRKGAARGGKAEC